MFQIDNHNEIALSRVIPYLLQFNEIYKLAKQSGDRAQVIEDIAWQLLYNLDYNQAEGVWLDYLGVKVGQNRIYTPKPTDAFTFGGTNAEGFGAGKFKSASSLRSTKVARSDYDFRNAIKSKIIQNNTDTSLDELIQACKLLFNAGVVIVTESYPANISLIELYGSNLIETLDANATIKKALPAGVSLSNIIFYNFYNIFRNDAFIEYNNIINNYNTTGNPNIVDDIASNFSSSNKITAVADLSNNSTIVYKGEVTYSTLQNSAKGTKIFLGTGLTSLGAGVRIGISSAGTYLQLDGLNNSFPNIALGRTLQNDDVIDFEFTFTSTNLHILLKVNGTTILDTDVSATIDNISTTPYLNMNLGYGGSTYFWTGSFDLSKFSVTADDVPVYTNSTAQLIPENHNFELSMTLLPDYVSTTEDIGILSQGDNFTSADSPVQIYYDNTNGFTFKIAPAVYADDNTGATFYTDENLSDYVDGDVGVLLQGGAGTLESRETTSLKVTRVGNVFSLYVNGTLVDSETVAYNIHIQSTNAKLFLGTSGDDTYYNSGSIYSFLIEDKTTGTIVLNDSLKGSTIGTNNGVKFI